MCVCVCVCQRNRKLNSVYACVTERPRVKVDKQKKEREGRARRGEVGGAPVLATVQFDHKPLSLNQGLWQNKAECDTTTAATAPAWQPPRFPSSPCLGSWPTFPCRPAKRIRTEGGEEGERRGEAKGKREPCCFSLVSSLRPQ